MELRTMQDALRETKVWVDRRPLTMHNLVLAVNNKYQIQ